MVVTLHVFIIHHSLSFITVAASSSLNGISQPKRMGHAPRMGCMDAWMASLAAGNGNAVSQLTNLARLESQGWLSVSAHRVLLVQGCPEMSVAMFVVVAVVVAESAPQPPAPLALLQGMLQTQISVHPTPFNLNAPCREPLCSKLTTKPESTLRMHGVKGMSTSRTSYLIPRRSPTSAVRVYELLKSVGVCENRDGWLVAWGFCG